MKLLLFYSALILLNAQAWAEERFGAFQGCGAYEVAGRITLAQGRLYVRVFPDSTNEVTLQINDGFQLKTAGHLDRSVYIQGEINVPLHDYRGTLKARALTERVPDPLRPEHDSGFRLLKAKACAKPINMR